MLQQEPELFGIGRLFWLTSESIVAADLATRRIVLWNPAAERVFGYTAGEAIGLPLETLVPEDLRAAHLAGIARYADTGDARLVGAGAIDVPAVDKAGNRLDISLTLTDVADVTGYPCVLAVIRDVTAQRRAERDLRLANDTLRDFIATASHDLRAPLTAVVGFAALLADRRLPAETHDRAIQAIERSASHATRLVNDLLTLSKLQAGAVTPKVELVDVAAIVNQAVEQANVDVEADIGTATMVLVDCDHLTRILVNYLTNAERHGAPPIRVNASHRPGHASIAVIDAGPGVDPSFAERLFSPFARGTLGDRQGTGLGLSIARGLAEANGGRAFYERTEAESRFCVELPAPG